MLDRVDGVYRMTCDNRPDHAWIYDRARTATEKGVREHARAHGWSVDNHGRDLCPTCSPMVVA
jgi:hypothetical protein